MMNKLCTILFLLQLHSCRPLFVPTRNTSSFRRNPIRVFAKQDTKKDTDTSLVSMRDPIVLRQYADALREEAKLLRKDLDDENEARRMQYIANVDKWIDEILIKVKIDESTQMLYEEDEVVQLIVDNRYSGEQINRIFDRICETSGQQSIDNCSPLITLLLDAACKVDCMEAGGRSKERWNNRVERDLRKKLFAMGWNIDIDEATGVDKTIRFLPGGGEWKH